MHQPVVAQHVGHRRSSRVAGQGYFSNKLPGRLVVGAEFGVVDLEVRHHLGGALAMRAALLADDEQGSLSGAGDHGPPARRAGGHDVVRRDCFGQVVHRCHPPMIARVQIDGRDPPVGRFRERYALHRLNRSHLSVVVDLGYRRLHQRGPQGSVTDET
jgi:hypothetical protein